MISMYSESAPFPVYCHECWFSDKWEASSYGRDYDFSKPFFTQFKELQNAVPRSALWQRNCTNSEYANMVAESKNVYLSVSVTNGSSDVFYSKAIDASFNIMDSYTLKSCDSCYENLEGEKNYNSQNLENCRNCIDSFFLIDCTNCSNCFMSSNLRNKQYCLRNQQYSKEDYFKELEKLNLGNRNERKILITEFQDLCERSIHRYANIVQAQNSTGNNLSNVKNCQNSFDVYDAENYNYSFRTYTSKDCMDYDYGQSSELMYECTTGAMYDSNVKFAYSATGNVRDSEYIDSCVSATNLFGCICIKKGENIILNKPYSKEEYEKLREKIIAHMSELPYIDQKGRSYSYGEFFPMEVSPFSYNETMAQNMEPITKNEAFERGYPWKDADEKNPNITIETNNIPDSINEVSEEILSEVLGCAHKGECNQQCAVGFRITQGELQFYKKYNIPLPDLCPNCRFYERSKKVLQPKLYDRTCMKCNEIKFKTPYAPGRPEIIYCESCYNKEIY
ncbi:MAG: hypothetical protein KBD55_02040 [Candidatus Pacebacteria bacterium]|nr:hypothetical protein [Candidatus Paceibacterota bacterium]